MANASPRYKSWTNPKTGKRETHPDKIVIGWVGEAYHDRKRIGKFSRTTKEEALEIAQAMEAEAANGPLPAGKLSAADRQVLTFEGYVINHWRWRRDGEVPISATVIGRHRRNLANHITPRWGNVQLRAIDEEDARTWYAELKTAGLSVHTRRSVHATFSAVLTDASADFKDLVPYNPVTKLLKVNLNAERKPIYPLNAEELARFIEAAPTPGARLYVKLQSQTGMRGQEMKAILGRNHFHKRCLLIIDGRIVTASSADREDGKPGSRREPGLKNGTKSHSLQLDVMSTELNDELRDWITDNNIGPNDLVFPDGLVRIPKRSRRQVFAQELTEEFIATLGFYEHLDYPQREMRHGTTYAKCNGCTCRWCKQAGREAFYAAADRKAAAEEVEARKSVLTYDHWEEIWSAMVAKAKVTNRFTSHQMRHTHATLLMNPPYDWRLEWIAKRLNDTLAVVEQVYTGGDLAYNADLSITARANRAA